MADFKYEIVEHIGTLSESAKGWTKELNRISWNGGEPKYDIRETGHRSTRRWERVLRCLRMRC